MSYRFVGILHRGSLELGWTGAVRQLGAEDSCHVSFLAAALGMPCYARFGQNATSVGLIQPMCHYVSLWRTDFRFRPLEPMSNSLIAVHKGPRLKTWVSKPECERVQTAVTTKDGSLLNPE